MRRRVAILGLTGLLAVGLAACATLPVAEAPGTLVVWAASDLENVGLEAQPVLETPGFFSAATRRLELTAAVNETVAAQVVLHAQGRSLNEVRAQIGDLVGPNNAVLPASRLGLFRAWYVPVEGFASWRLLVSDAPPPKAEIADCLIPVGGGPLGDKITIAGGRNQPLWLDVSIPPGLPAGVYTGTLKITAAETAPYDLAVQVTVLDLTLPEQPTLPVAGGLGVQNLWRGTLSLAGQPHAPPRMIRSDPQFERARTVLDRTSRLLADHGVSPMLRGLSPAVGTTVQGTLDVDFGDVTALLTPPASQPAVVGPLARVPLDATSPDPQAFGGADSREYRDVVRVYLQACRQWLARERPRGRGVVDLTDQAGATAEVYDRLRGLANIARAVDPAWWTAVGQPTLALAPAGWTGHFDQGLDPPGLLRVPPAAWLDPQAVPALHAQGQKVGLRPGTPPFSPGLAIEADSVDAVALPWVAWRYGLDALWLDELVAWPAEPLKTAPADASARYLLYPPASEAEDTPYPSVRLKRLRRGLQDHAYLTLLSRLGGAGTTAPAGPDLTGRQSADQLARLLVSFAGAEAFGENYRDARPGGWSAKPEHYRLATELLREALRAGYAGRPATWADQSLAFNRLRSQRLGLRVEIEGVRLRPKAGQAAVIEVEIGVLIRNELEQPTAARVRFGPLPAGWVAVQDRLAVDGLGVQDSRRVSLRAEAPTMPGGRAGVFTQPIIVETTAGWRSTVQARVAALASPTVSQPPAMDGDLGDWPMPLANVAADFRVPGRFAGQPERLARPDKPTVAMVAHDATHLYVAVHAQEPPETPHLVTPSNVVTHDGLLAWQEDLVQILLDPGSRGTGDAGDLFVLTVKPTGVVVARRGADVQPPIGRSTAWATTARVATRKQDNGWTLEAAIPLADFGPDAAGQAFWGFDVARHDSSTGQSSAWSGSGRHFYNTRSLGNLILLSVDATASPAPAAPAD